MDRKWWTLIAVCTGTFMLLLDITVVNVALPDIQKSLDSSFADLQWVVDAYALTLAAFLLTAGVLGDMFGRRGVFAIGLGIFSVSSLLCGLSTSPLMLNLARGAQGVGGAIMFATSLALIAQAFSGRERGTAFGVYGAVVGGAVAVGPLVGGAITSGIGWRWIFFVNMPLGVVAIVDHPGQGARTPGTSTRRIDWIGFVTFSASLFMLVFALVQGNAKGWGSPTIVGLLVGSGVLMAVFLVAEWREGPDARPLPVQATGHGRGVARPPSPCRPRSSPCSCTSRSTCRRCWATARSPPGSGSCPSPCSPSWWRRWPASSPSGSSPATCSGWVCSSWPWAASLMTRVQADSTWTVLLPGFIVAGIGVGITNPVLASATVSVVPPERSGMATGSSSTFRQVGHRHGHRRTGGGLPQPDPTGHGECPDRLPGRAGGAGPRGQRVDRGHRRERRPRGGGRVPVASAQTRCSLPTGSGSPRPSTT